VSYTFAPTGADGYAQAAKLAATDGAPGTTSASGGDRGRHHRGRRPHDAPDASAAGGAVVPSPVPASRHAPRPPS
jgi:hypothetical protein